MDTIIYNNRNKTPGQFDDHAKLSPPNKKSFSSGSRSCCRNNPSRRGGIKYA